MFWGQAEHMKCGVETELGHADIYMLGTELVQFSLHDDCAVG
jgi:hypothetical protein